MAWTEITRWDDDRRSLRYASDTMDAEWGVIEPFMPPPSKVGRLRKTDLREVWNAIQYIVATGCQWLALPKDFPPYSTVQYWFYKFRDEGSLNWSTMCCWWRLSRRAFSWIYRPIWRTHNWNRQTAWRRQGLRCHRQTLGRRAHLRMVRAMQTPRQRLGKIHRLFWRLGLSRQHPNDLKAIGKSVKNQWLNFESDSEPPLKLGDYFRKRANYVNWSLY